MTQVLHQSENLENKGAPGARVIVACGAMIPELMAQRPDPDKVEIRELDQNLHRTPDLMTEIIQEEIDKVEGYAGEIVLAYGLCSNGVVGLKARGQRILIPRVHDCIAIFLGSRQAYQEAHNERAGTYYLTPGWVKEKKDPIGFMEDDYVPRVGRETAEWALREELKHYTHIVLIDTGVGEMAPLRERARMNADFLDMKYLEVKGRRDYFEKILFGPYHSKDFVVIEPGQEVVADPFMA